VASGTVAKRLLVKPAKTTSAGFFLALVVAALVLGGCGGGSSDASSSGSSPSGAPGSSSAGSASGTASSGAGSGTSSAQPATGGGPAPGEGAVPAAGAASGEAAIPGGSNHGSRVPQPKGEPEPGITPQQHREATIASISLESPSSQPSSAGPEALPATYTCDGRGTSPALRWHGVPPGTAELVIFAMNVQPVEGSLFFDWAVAGLNPDLEQIEAGKLPKGAIVARNGFGKVGYEICPEGGGETFMFSVFALPEKLSPAQGFDPSSLRREVLGASGNVGLLALSYTRG
jgi:phosphatidylethanolamine-binding protein (PEBP) family uncharacterized protein